jgi:hypothetical protein
VRSGNGGRTRAGRRTGHPVLSTKQIATLAAAGVVVVAAGVGGYLWGHGTAPSQREATAAREAAYESALAAARADAETPARTRGLEKGRRAGERTGRSQGARDGASAGSADANEELAATIPQTSSSEETASTTESCGPGEYNYQGNGCVPLNCPGAGCAHPPTPPATPATCPEGWHPVGITGACAPP